MSEESILPKQVSDADKEYLESRQAFTVFDSAVQHLIHTKPQAVSAGLKHFSTERELHRYSDALYGKHAEAASSNAWLALKREYLGSAHQTIANVILEGNRLANFAVEVKLGEECRTGENMIYLDASKSNVTSSLKNHLLAVLQKANFDAARNAMFRGDAINVTENRSVLHTALRNMDADAVVKDSQGNDVMIGVRAVREKVKGFSDSVRNGTWKGHTGKPVKFIVNIGIGGSDLGPVMTAEALRPYAQQGLQALFVSNVDGAQIAEVLRAVDLEETLFVVSSKTFTTVETLRNANTARDALLAHYGDKATDAVAKHFVAVSTNGDKVAEFGISRENMFEFWDWVGGRYSLWSSIGLSVAILIGWENYTEILTGAHKMDQHFLTAPPESNLPVLLALTGIFYINLVGCDSHAILPYSQYLHRLPAYIQQLDMESNGKSASTSKTSCGVDMHTGPVIFGEPGTNGQHAFYQLLHQGTRPIPCDFIGTLESHHPIAGNEHHRMLMANMFAQSEALMNGKPIHVAAGELNEVRGINQATKDMLQSHKAFPGNRPSNTIVMRSLTPRSFGALIAAYEHKVFTQGVVWGIDSFDQFGVELGKTLATTILNQMLPAAVGSGHDASTNALLTMFNATLAHAN